MDEKKSNEGKSKKKKPRRRGGAYARRKGHNYELQIIKEHTDMGFEGLVSSRSESKRLDDAKIDVADTENVLPYYIQCKKTKNTPSIQKLNDEVGFKDKPLVIFWARQENRKVNMITSGEYCLVPKDLFYEFVKDQKNYKELISKLKEIKNKQN